MVQVSFEIQSLPDRCSDRLLSNAQTLKGKVLGLTRIPCAGEWIEFQGVLYEVTKVRHTPIAVHRDALVEVKYCEQENSTLD